MKIFYFSQPTNCGKKPFPEADHLRKRLIFYYDWYLDLHINKLFPSWLSSACSFCIISQNQDGILSGNFTIFIDICKIENSFVFCCCFAKNRLQSSGFLCVVFQNFNRIGNLHKLIAVDIATDICQIGLYCGSRRCRFGRCCCVGGGCGVVGSEL